MKAITVRQPWAQAGIDGIKPIENRSGGFTLNHRGDTLWHAAKGWSERGGFDDRIRGAYPSTGPDSFGYALRHKPAYGGHPPWPFAWGVVLGVIEIVDAHPEQGGCCQPWGESRYADAQGKQRTDVVHLVLENPRKLEIPVNAKGALGLWTAPEDLADFVLEMVA